MVNQVTGVATEGTDNCGEPSHRCGHWQWSFLFLPTAFPNLFIDPRLLVSLVRHFYTSLFFATSWDTSDFYFISVHSKVATLVKGEGSNSNESSCRGTSISAISLSLWLGCDGARLHAFGLSCLLVCVTPRSTESLGRHVRSDPVS